MAYEKTMQGYRNQYDFCHGLQWAANCPSRPADTAFFLPRVPRAVSSQIGGRLGPAGTEAPHRAGAKLVPLCILSRAGDKQSWVEREACFSRTLLITVICLL